MMLYYSTVISLITDTEFIMEFIVNISEYFFKGKYLFLQRALSKHIFDRKVDFLVLDSYSILILTYSQLLSPATLLTCYNLLLPWIP